MLTIDVEKTGDVAVVRCGGRIVRGQEVRTLRSAVVSERDSRIVVLDLSEVESLDAGGLTTLLSLHQWARSRGVQLKLVNPSHFVREILVRTSWTMCSTSPPWITLCSCCAERRVATPGWRRLAESVFVRARRLHPISSTGNSGPPSKIKKARLERAFRISTAKAQLP